MSEQMQRKPSRVGLIIGILIFIVVVGFLTYTVQRSDRVGRDALPSPLINKPAPDFALPVLHDSKVIITKKDLLGSPYLLNVWGSWCPQCQVEHPVLSKFAMTKRVRVVGYNYKDESADALAWLEKFGNPYMLVITDYDGRAAIGWGIYGAPETFLVDQKGVIRWKYVGPLTDDIIEKQMLPVLEQIEKGG